MSHTPEPWALFEVGDRFKHQCPVSSDKTSILTIATEDGTQFGAVYNNEDARRIVACVNACAGLETEAIEAIQQTASIVAGKLKKHIQERDELLAALEEVVRISDRKHDAWDRAKAAIDKCKGGAA